uniref:Uncharacterized protein n=1 Tax=Tanacetum cinerariifolium TaxID=118510 RepID=A0A699I6Q9_TANCI|nr:hypothetical protein [Tanacetum cinerariifolium]
MSAISLPPSPSPHRRLHHETPPATTPCLGYPALNSHHSSSPFTPPPTPPAADPLHHLPTTGTLTISPPHLHHFRCQPQPATLFIIITSHQPKPPPLRPSLPIWMFSDGTLNDVRNALNDRLKGIRMQYLPSTIWMKGDKDRAAAMIQAIEKMLKTRRIMRSLEKFVGGRLYEGDLRMLQKTI